MWYEKASKAAMMTFMCALLLAVGLPAVAQTQGPMRDQSKEAGGPTALSLDQGVLGQSLKTRQGETAGTIDDVIFSRQGRIAHYLADVGPFQGIGEKIVALNPDQVQFTGQNYVFNGTRADLESLPEVNPYDYGLYHGYYGPSSRPYYGSYGGGYMGGPYDQGPRAQYQERQGQYQAYPRREYYGRTAGGISGDDFLSAQVFDPQRNLIGEVEDLVVDPATNRVTYAVIGVKDRQVLVPLNQLWYAGGDSVIYRGTERQLERMPEYQVGQGGRVTAGTSQMRQQKAGSSAPGGSAQPQSGGGQAHPQQKQGSSQQQ